MELETIDSLKKQVYAASRDGVKELIKVLKEPIVASGDDDLAADKLTRAAQAKKIACFEALDMLERVDKEEKNMLLAETGDQSVSASTPESRAKKK